MFSIAVFWLCRCGSICDALGELDTLLGDVWCPSRRSDLELKKKLQLADCLKECSLFFILFRRHRSDLVGNCNQLISILNFHRNIKSIWNIIAPAKEFCRNKVLDSNISSLHWPNTPCYRETTWTMMKSFIDNNCRSLAHGSRSQ